MTNDLIKSSIKISHKSGWKGFDYYNNYKVQIGNYSLPMIASSTRSVFGDYKYVVKVGDTYQNETEYKMWNKIKNTKYAKHFVPVYTFGHQDGESYLVQKRIYGITFDELSPEHQLPFIKQFMKIKGIAHDLNIQDINDYNVMLLPNGQLKIFDMGIDG